MEIPQSLLHALSILGNGGDNPSDSCKVKAPEKNKEISQKFRDEATVLFTDGFYIDAIDKYNQSLCYALPTDLGPIFSKRAAALFRMNLPNECLKSIALAEASECPKQLRDMLTKMTAQCQARLPVNDQEESQFRLPLSYPGHEKLPFVANRIELCTTAEQGRHLVATKDLKVGDVVILERPFVATLFPSARHKFCSYCMAGDKRHMLIPCPTCTGTLYCSEDCLNNAWAEYHRYECQISEKLKTIDDEIESIAVRSLLMGVSVYGGLREFQEYLADHQDSKPSVFDLDHTQVDRKSQFLALHHLYSAGEHLPVVNKALFKQMSAKWARLIVDKKVFGDIDGDQSEFIRTTMYRYLISATLNSFRTSNHFQPYVQREPVYASQQLAMALINHSCVANVNRLQQDNQQLVVVSRPIKKGEALVDIYAKGYYATPRDQRKRYYLQQYGFTCKCKACELNYPFGIHLVSKPGLKRFMPDGGENTPGDRASLEKNLALLNRYMQKNDRFFPCAQLNEADTDWESLHRTLLTAHLWEQQMKFMRFRKGSLAPFMNFNMQQYS